MPSDTGSNHSFLGFDTSGGYCAAAVIRGGEIVVARHHEMSRGQAEYLMPLLDETLTEAGIGWQDLSALGVGIGPGNFTGIRISVAAARGLALGLKVPAVGVSLLDAQAYGSAGPVLSCLAAPRERVYLAGYNLPTDLAPQLVALDDLFHDFATDLAPALDQGLTCIGTGAEAVAMALDAPCMPAAHDPAVAIAQLTAQRWQDVTTPPAPLYLRAADAAPARDTAPVLLDG